MDRYYYAIVECDTIQTASYVYSELQGAELERSANILNLSFVPDDMTFDEEYRLRRPDLFFCCQHIDSTGSRDQATSKDERTDYQPLDFATDVRSRSTRHLSRIDLLRRLFGIQKSS